MRHRWLDLWCRLNRRPGSSWMEVGESEKCLDGQLFPVSLVGHGNDLQRSWRPGGSGDNPVLEQKSEVMLLEQSGRECLWCGDSTEAEDGLPSGGTPDDQAAMDLEHGAWWRSLIGAAVCHTGRRGHGAHCGLAGGAHWLCPCWIFLSTVSETAVPLSTVIPPTPCSPRVPSVTQHPWVLSRKPWHLPWLCTLSLALACFWKWDMSSLRSQNLRPAHSLD